MRCLSQAQLSEEIRLAAVRQSGMAIQYIPYQSKNEIML